MKWNTRYRKGTAPLCIAPSLCLTKNQLQSDLTKEGHKTLVLHRELAETFIFFCWRQYKRMGPLLPLTINPMGLVKVKWKQNAGGKQIKKKCTLVVFGPCTRPQVMAPARPTAVAAEASSDVRRRVTHILRAGSWQLSRPLLTTKTEGGCFVAPQEPKESTWHTDTMETTVPLAHKVQRRCGSQNRGTTIKHHYQIPSQRHQTMQIGWGKKKRKLEEPNRVNRNLTFHQLSAS